jgi:type VI secretion system protein ImpH
MATHNWGTNRPLEDFLFSEAHLFDFYQAVRLLERLRPETNPIAEQSDSSKEPAIFKSRVTLGFPPSDIETIREGTNGSPAEVYVNFMGLAGAFGPLPSPFVELIISREVHRDWAFRDFLDLFNHRLLSLMYRVRKTHRLGMEIKSPDDIPFAGYLLALMGLGMKSLRGRLKVSDRAFLYYAGLITQKPHSITGLERILSHYFRVAVKGVQLCGRWQILEHDQVTIIGVRGQNCVLGESAVLGTRVWDQQSKFRLIVGPVRAQDFEDFLPTGSRFQPMVEITRFYVGREKDFEINLIMKARDVPSARLTSASGRGGPRLGWTSWVKTGDFTADAAQVVLTAPYAR